MFVHESGLAGAPTILFLHGNGSSGLMWKNHLAHLTGFHCLAPDFPGFGRSREVEWDSLEDTADRMIDLIAGRASGGRAHVVGLSLGGSTAIRLLSKASERVDHAIVDGAGVLPLAGLPLMKIGFRLLQPFLHTEFVIRMVANGMKIPADGYAEFRQGMLDMSRASFTNAFLQALSQRKPAGFERTPNRVLFVAGENEPAAVHQSNRMLASELPNAECRAAPGLGHGWLGEAPGLHVRMVEAWLGDQPLPVELQAPPV